jgi:hypothetical protein
MKKRITQKLELSKETLRNLSERDLQAAVGGASHYVCPTEDPNCTASGCPSHWSDCCP